MFTVSSTSATSSAGHTSLSTSRLDVHASGFLILESDSDATETTPPNQILFHGSPFSLETPSKKHLKEYQANLKHGNELLLRLNLNLLNTEQYKPLRRHSDTVFLPVDLGNNQALYIYPWSSNRTSLPVTLPTIKQFVMTNCLFGAFILGVDDQGNKYPLIDHNLEVEDIITRIEVDDAIHPYESMSFAALQGLFSLMKKISNTDFSIRYHLPIIDYMLYGLHLYISGKIAFDALETFIEKIKERGKKHKKIISTLAEKAKIRTDIGSPFDNLLSKDVNLTASVLLEQLSLSDAQVERMKGQHAKFSRSLSRTAQRGGHKIGDFRTIIDVLNTLDEFIPASATRTFAESDSDSIASDPSRSPRELFETLCIENILKRLSTNNENLEYQQVWRAIIDSGKVDRFSPLQQLFKIANIAFVARACLGHANFEVCSLLPIDENPIAQAYKDLLSSKLGHILCLSWFPPLLNYVNHGDKTITTKPHHKYNLFRLRSDLLTINHEEIQRHLTAYFKLPSDFWPIVEESFFDAAPSDKIAQQIISAEGQLLHGQLWTAPNPQDRLDSTPALHHTPATA